MSAQTIGRYEITGELGRGGMATVFLAHDPAFKRTVAVKVLPRQFTHDPHFRARFEREAQVIAGLEHAYIVPVYDFGQEGDQPYIVMRHMPGGTLADRIANGPMALADAGPIVQRVADALDAAHRRGIIHRDLKPTNILFDDDDHAYLSDFGIAKIAQESSTLTGTGAMIGTPEFMSPEQAMGHKSLDHRSDIYSFGIILYEMLTSGHPYEADTPVGQMLKHVSEPVPALDTARYNLPAQCAAVVARAMAKKPEARYASAGALAGALVALGGARTIVSPPPTIAAQPPPTVQKQPKSAPPPPVAPPPSATAPPAEDAPKPLSEIPCAHCAGAGLTLQPDGSVACRFCGTPNPLSATVCPECEYVNRAEAEYCEHCRQALVLYCPNCLTQNWRGLEDCAACGSRMDALAYLSDRYLQGTPEYKQQQLPSVRAVKEAEEAASRRRMAQMMEVEERRQKEFRAAAARRAARERQIMQVLAVAVVLALALIGVVVLVSLSVR